MGRLLAVALVLSAWSARGEGASSPADPHLAVTPTADGVLLSNETFLLYLRTQVALEQCNLRVVSRDALLQETAARAERSWVERHGFWVGVGVGFITSTIVVWQVKGLLSK
jgi:hypothetical protein